ncbi:hypothetical protein VNI00_015143 [Paramarasmius palmivorus]|uniref:Uncharacterized protein n=1 Tax=Paramarasmius palmivorus TaxID=297713 RepID=A0AAW0BNW7_9AGAR
MPIPSEEPPILVIVVVTIGAIFLIIVVIPLYVYYHRRHSNRLGNDSTTLHIIARFLTIMHFCTNLSQRQRESQPQMDNSARGNTQRVERHDEEVPPDTLPPRQPRFRRHEDSGWRPRYPPPPPSESGSSNIIDVPPDYETAIS